MTEEIQMTDTAYHAFLAQTKQNFSDAAEIGPLFTTDVPGSHLWVAYLNAFPEATRQQHRCRACEQFILRFGGLVGIDDFGSTYSALWRNRLPGNYYSPAAEALDEMLRPERGTRVNGVFLSDKYPLGIAQGPRDLQWEHLHATVPAHAKCWNPKYRTHSDEQAMAEKKEDYRTVSRALGEFSIELLEQACKLLEAEGALYRGEKVLGPATWLRDLQQAREQYGRNAVWKAVATAPAGFCHPRSSMIGTLLEDLGRGLSAQQAAAAFKSKMHPLQYQRPQAAPSDGAIEAAEKLFAKLGLAPALRRRFARLDDIERLVFWKPLPVQESSAPESGVFDHLRKKPAGTQPMEYPAADPMSWEKFARLVLPRTLSLLLEAPIMGDYGAMVTASDPKAPLLFQWDYPLSWYRYHMGSHQDRWGVKGWVPVTAIAKRPGHELAHMGEGVMLVLEGAKDAASQELALFPETLRSELHGVRAVIEAHSKRSTIEGRLESSASGLLFGKNTRSPMRLRVTDAGGDRRVYTIDRWD